MVPGGQGVELQSLLMIYGAYMPVYKCNIARANRRADGSSRGNKRGSRGPKNQQIVVPFAKFMLFVVIVFQFLFGR